MVHKCAEGQKFINDAKGINFTNYNSTGVCVPCNDNETACDSSGATKCNNTAGLYLKNASELNSTICDSCSDNFEVCTDFVGISKCQESFVRL